jgi:amino acid transporter
MDSYNSDPSGGAAIFAIFAIFGLFFFFIAIVYYVLSSIFYMKLFDKAGVQGKWRGWVPIYREMIFSKLGDLSPWWILVIIGGGIVIGLIPYLGAILGWLFTIAGYVYLAMAAYRVQQKLGKEAPWVVLYVLLQIVWLGIMAFDKSRWNSNVPPAPWANSFLADKTQWPGIPVQSSVGGYGQPGYPAAGAQAPGAYPPAPGAYPPPPAGYTPPPAGGATPPPPAPGGPTPPGGPTEPPAAPEPPRP